MSDKDVVIKYIIFAVVLFSTLLVSTASRAVTVIANNSVAVRSLSSSELRRIFSMRTVSWPDGAPVAVYVLPSKHPLHQKFSRNTLKIFPYQLDRVWNKLTFSGMGVPPIVVASPQLLQEAISKTPGAIGYTEGTALMPNVHTIEIKG